MDTRDQAVVERPEFDELMRLLDHRSAHVVQVLGVAGVGKTTLLRMAQSALTDRSRPVILIPLLAVPNVDALGAAIMEEVGAESSPNQLHRMVPRSSSGGVSLDEVARMLNESARQMPGSPVLMMDDFDAYANRLESGIRQLVLGLPAWSIVVASRPESSGLLRVRNTARIVLSPFTPDESTALVRSHAVDLSDAAVDLIVAAADGNPRLLSLLARDVSSGRSSLASADEAVTDVFERVLDDILGAAPASSQLDTLVDELAIRGGQADIAVLARLMNIPPDAIRRLATTIGRTLVDVDHDIVEFVHPAFRDIVLAQRIRFAPVRLSELQFGSEEAEKDDLLLSTFVTSRSVRTILDQRRSIVIGDRGSGKSALFRTLPNADPSVRVCPIANSGDLLHRVVAKDAWRDTQALRAAWLVVIAAVVAGEIPANAPAPLRNAAAALRSALRLPTPRPRWSQRAIQAALTPFRGTKLSFAVGPVTLNAELPSGSAKHHGPVDVETFMDEADAFLCTEMRRVHVMIDRIDETYKYDRDVQEALVQALLQAEAHISLFTAIGVIVFLRTDLFEVYDIQEKTKLVSRTLALDWTGEEWLRVVAGRLLANKQLSWLARRMPTDDNLAARTALSILFPAEIENQPIDRWLITSLRNGNGDVSPRLAVLLLHLAREVADESETTADAPPIFSAAALSAAMTRLSELSFSEVINDFKIASTFVLNCRAGRLDAFTTNSVANLFDESEGTRSEQVRLLERLGFLERVVHTTDTGVESSFRIPKLYTRCWDPA
jgi:energy-coupling factor transporter ATP-binding protein EcfA2